MGTVDATIPVEADVAAVLQDDPERRAAVGRLVSMVVRPAQDADPLLGAMRELSADARAPGRTSARGCSRCCPRVRGGSIRHSRWRSAAIRQTTSTSS